MSSAYGEKLLHEPESVAGRLLHAAQSAAMNLGRVLAYVFVALAIRSLLQFQLQVGNRLGFDRPSLAWSLVFLALTAPCGILIHEGGHFLAGALLHMHCRRFVVGPIELARRARGWTLRWIPIRRAGLVDFVPSTFVQFRIRRAVCIAGGPLASLLAGLVFTALSLRVRTSPLFWICSDSAQWALVGFAGLLPIRRGAVRSDGNLLWELMRGGMAVDVLQRNLLVASSHATPLRMRDWPHDVVHRVAEISTDLEARRYNAYLAYVHFLDRGDSQMAGLYLNRLLADWTPSDPPEYALETAYFLALYGHDLPTARKWLTRETRDAEPWVRLRAQAAIEREEGQREKARILVDEALGALRAAPACGAHQYEVDRLLALFEE
jgi:hypothetical protein